MLRVNCNVRFLLKQNRPNTTLQRDFLCKKNARDFLVLARVIHQVTNILHPKAYLFNLLLINAAFVFFRSICLHLFITCVCGYNLYKKDYAQARAESSACSKEGAYIRS